MDFLEIPSTEIQPLEVLLKKKEITQLTYEKVILAKQYIERKYYSIKIRKIENEVIKEKLNKANIPKEKKEEILNEIKKIEKNRLKKKREKLTIFDYESIEIIGRGAFGEVYVCRNKKTKEIVAIKKIRKTILLEKNQVKHIRDEQDFLSKIKSNWIVELKSSFQEGEFLYLIMEYLPGGDLKKLLLKKKIFNEEEAKFYICEMILAIETIHVLNCIHRDIKPDNILIDKYGHIKLGDFGLAKISNNVFKEDIINYKGNQINLNYSCVGTPYYVAPEVLYKQNYGKEIDWWSLGVIFFEMIFGYAPFASKKPTEVCYKVIHFKEYFKIPDNIKISENAKDLIISLITDSNLRLGKNGSDEIKSHPFFKGVNWKNIKEMKPPFIPILNSDFDVKYFQKFESNDNFYPDINNKKRKDAEYIGYTFRGEDSNVIDFISIVEIIQQKQKEHLENKEKKKEINLNFNNIITHNNKNSRNDNYNEIYGIKNLTFDVSSEKRINKVNVNKSKDEKDKSSIKKNKVIKKINLKSAFPSKIIRIFSKSKSKIKNKNNI